MHVILDRLIIKDKEYEEYVAHYTRPTIAFKLIEKGSPSKLRLGSIKNVNDPMEGKVLSKYLEYNETENDDLLTFVSCFTFNHDSLNQFRLYGKENNEEASGTSLVLDCDSFFNQDNNISLAFQFYNLTKNKVDSKLKGSGDNNGIFLPLYRCIYIDPESNYLSLASRDKITFYRDNSGEKWDLYFKNIAKRTKEIDGLLNKIKRKVTKIPKSSYWLLNEILLPLKYLIKHAAFEEEQEARIFYIASLWDKKIHASLDEMYIEYGKELSEKNIHKVYLSVGASKYQDIFRRELNDIEGEVVKVSKNPFRNKK
ncbi:DUF2971 domain-containing protein [Otariodibacter oris]|uniref:DUF2971 family protein n=1 Tax=Otariodibacter oris TaxID=1032623 RepID=A0A420XHM1_9PAST|nr:DUF2971 domain-containing protein [Otariodibacter oris]QGM80958.1 hypothetical protein A6A10_05850 [Otariodibacter oris]RKR76864.1 DUF2971 family protein [Otariodibacter oris]